MTNQPIAVDLLNNHVFQQLIPIAKSSHIAAIQYQKAVLDNNPIIRLIEPYSLVQGKQDIMLRAFQVDAEAGWRFFMLHKIIKVSDHGTTFTPRRKITLTDGVITNTYNPFESWTPPVQKYRDLILETLADMQVTEREQKIIRDFRKVNNISTTDMLTVHNSIFNNCQKQILCDGIIDTEETKQLSELNQCLGMCGAKIF